MLGICFYEHPYCTDSDILLFLFLLTNYWMNALFQTQSPIKDNTNTILSLWIIASTKGPQCKCKSRHNLNVFNVCMLVCLMNPTFPLLLECSCYCSNSRNTKNVTVWPWFPHSQPELPHYRITEHCGSSFNQLLLQTRRSMVSHNILLGNIRNITSLTLQTLSIRTNVAVLAWEDHVYSFSH